MGGLRRSVLGYSGDWPGLLTGNDRASTFNETDSIYFDINEIVSLPDFLHKGACPVFVTTFHSWLRKYEKVGAVGRQGRGFACAYRA